MLKVVFVDIETTGLDPLASQILEIAVAACTLVVPDDGSPCELTHTCGEPLHICLEPRQWPLTYSGSVEAMEMNKALIQELESDKYPRFREFDASAKIRRYLIEAGFLDADGGGKILWGGKNVKSLDLPFLSAMNGWRIKSLHRCIDIGNLLRSGSDGSSLTHRIPGIWGICRIRVPG